MVTVGIAVRVSLVFDISGLRCPTIDEPLELRLINLIDAKMLESHFENFPNWTPFGSESPLNPVSESVPGFGSS